jgi:hypothetical protein
VRLALEPITRWQGTIKEIGLRLDALPTAREAFAFPKPTAICL